MAEQGIYKIINLKNGKFYIGSSNNLAKRWTDHLYRLRNHKHLNKHLQNAFDKYGESAFAFVVIEFNPSWTNDELRAREQEYLDYYFKICPEKFYNMAPKAVGGNSTNFSEEALQSISEKNRKLTKKQIEGIKTDILNGMSKKDIAVKYHTNPGTLSAMLRVCCPELTQGYIRRQKILATVKMYNDGFTYKEIAEELNTSITMVCDYLHHRYERFFLKPSNTLTKEQLDTLVSMYDRGYGNVVIANKLGIDHIKVARWKDWIDLIRSTDLIDLALTRALKDDSIIIQKDKDGQILEEYKSESKIVQKYPEMARSTLNKAIKEQKEYKGFFWEREDRINNVCPISEVYAYRAY